MVAPPGCQGGPAVTDTVLPVVTAVGLYIHADKGLISLGYGGRAAQNSPEGWQGPVWAVSPHGGWGQGSHSPILLGTEVPGWGQPACSAQSSRVWDGHWGVEGDVEEGQRSPGCGRNSSRRGQTPQTSPRVKGQQRP